MTAYLSEMNREWKGDENPVVVANEYSKALHRSAASCDLAPEVLSASQVEAASYRLKQHRDTEGSIREIEIPFELLNGSSQNKLGRTPYEYEIVLLQIDKHTLGQNFQIQRDLPELNATDIKMHQKEVHAAMAKEWNSWNDHGTFKPRLRSAATNVIDSRWVLKWKIVDGVKTVKARLCVCVASKTVKLIMW